MDNIDSINMSRSQSPVMLEMRQMAAMAGSGLEFGTIQPAAANSPFFPVEKGANNLSFLRCLTVRLRVWTSYNTSPVRNRPRWIWASVTT